jgi:Uma2 family endonuclease
MLESGDHLTPEEFDAIYAEDYEGRAELIDGLCTCPHQSALKLTETRITSFPRSSVRIPARTPGVRSTNDGSIRFPDGSRVQPDVSVSRRGPAGSRTEQDYFVSAPGLVAEVAASNANIDMHEKKELYRRNSVPEYLVWRVLDREMDLFRLDGGAYVRVEPGASGVLKSAEFPGLVIPAAQLIAGDFGGAFTTVLAAIDARG